MSNSDLVCPETVGKFISAIHEQAARAIYGLRDPRPCFLHLCSQAPDDRRFFHSAYAIGDTERMIADALIEAGSNKNVYVEPRLVRGGLPCERGRAEATEAVIAVVADSDHDTGKPFAAPIPASAVVGTSPPNNAHGWYFLKHAVGFSDAAELGKLMREGCGGDRCSGNPVQPFRLPGCGNFPDSRKRARGRIVVPTRLLRITDKTYTAAELRSHFSPAAQLDYGPISPAVAHRPAYCRSRARAILAADPCDDRSAQFMSAMNYAALGGLTIAEVESIARQHLNGCAGKYADRLTREIARCYDKIAREQK